MKIIDLFAGCGGLSLGLHKAGIEVMAAFEIWDAAIDCYRANFDHPIFKEDLSDSEAIVKIISSYSPDMIVGGPPCQDFSTAGKRSEGNRANLTKSYATIVASIKPEWFIMENVARAQKSEAYEAARNAFKNAGYGLTERVLDASYCGVPQKRKRFFCIGKIGEIDGFLNKTIDSTLSKKPMTIREYAGESFDIEHYYRHPRNYSRRAVFSIDEPSPTIRGVSRPVPEGYKGHAGDTANLNGVRCLTTAERALIQTFPPTFKMIGAKTNIEQMIGNAVPVNLAAFVGKAIISYQIGRSSIC